MLLTSEVGAVDCMAAMDTISKYLLVPVFLWVLFPISISCFYVQPGVITFHDSPQSQVLLENSSLVVTCALDYKSLDHSLPALPSIKWQYNGVDSSSCKSNTSYGISSIVSVCKIELININDTGWYRCAAIDGEIDCVPPCFPTITVSSAAYVLVIGESIGIEQVQMQSTCSSIHLVPFELLYGVSTVTVHFDFFWEKDGQPINANITEIQILPSGVLLITNSAENQYFGLYTCINEHGIVIKKYEIVLNESSKPANLELTVISSFSSSSLVDFVPLPDNSVELICHSSSVCVTDTVYWYYNSVELLNDGQNWLRNDDIRSGNYCCILNSLSSCITVVDSERIKNDSTSYLTTDEDIKSVILLNCSTAQQDVVHWVYNGQIIPRTQSDDFSSVYSVEVWGSNASSVIGVFQCLIRNTSHTPLCTHRILPFGLPNPPASVSLSTYRPSMSVMYGTHTIICDPPMYLGGLNNTELRYNVVFESYDTPEKDLVPLCTNNFYQICNISCIMDGFWEEGHRVFYVQMTKSDGEIISQLSSGVQISAQECDVYVPATPIISWLCTVNLTLEWQKAFFPDFDYTLVDLECYSGEAKIEEYSNTVSPSIQSSTIQFPQQLLAVGDVCSYTAYGSSDSCIGIKTSETCTITLVEELIISSTITQLNTDSHIMTSFMTTFYPSSSVRTLVEELIISSTIAQLNTDSHIITSFMTTFYSSSSVFNTYTVISSPRPIASVILSSADITSRLESATSVILSSSTNTILPTVQPSNPSPINYTVTIVIASGAVIITLLTVGISCIMTLVGHRLWKKSRRSIDWSGSTVDISSNLNNNEVDVLSIITITDEILYNFDSEIANGDKLPARISLVREEIDEEVINIKERGRDDIATNGCSFLQVASADTSGGTTTSKTSEHSSISSLNHKTSAYSAFSESSGYSSRSEDYVDYSYAKHKLYYTPPYGQQLDDSDSERIEMNILYRTDTSCPPILELKEDDVKMKIRDCFEGNEQELNVDKCFTSSDEDLSYQNVADATNTACDFVRPCRHSHVSHCNGNAELNHCN